MARASVLSITENNVDKSSILFDIQKEPKIPLQVS